MQVINFRKLPAPVGDGTGAITHVLTVPASAIVEAATDMSGVPVLVFTSEVGDAETSDLSITLLSNADLVPDGAGKFIGTATFADFGVRAVFAS